MAYMQSYLVAQPSIDSLAFGSGRRITRSPLSIAFDDNDSRPPSVDLGYEHDGRYTPAIDREKRPRMPIAPQISFDPIIVRDVDFKDPTVVEWDGPADPANPMNWSLSRKVWMSLIASMMAFAISLASSIFSADVHVTAWLFAVSEEVMVLGVSLYVLGFACGPLFFGPISELYGRSQPLMLGFICFAIFQVPLAVAENLYTIFICRFFAAAFGAAPLAIGPGILVDMWQPYARGMATLSWLLALYAGTTSGPIVGVFTLGNPNLGWRWTAWLTLLVSAFIIVLSLFTVSESFAPILLQRKAARLRLETRNWALHSKRDEEPISYAYLVRKYGIKPLQMLVQEPILATMTAFMSLVYAIMYLMFIGIPYSFELVRAWDTGTAALPFLGLFVGYFLAFLICNFESTFRYKQLLIKNNGKVVPEERLPTMIAGSFVVVGGLFLFGWTSYPTITWIPQVLATIPIGCGTFLVFVPAQVYLMDVYTVNAASALAANACVRAVLACAFPLVATPMYDRLGITWGMTVLGGLCVALCPFPILFYVFGHKIRSWSKYVPEQKDRR